MRAEDEKLAAMLLEKGLLSPEEHAEALAAAASSGDPLPKVLVDRKLLGPAQVDSAVNSIENRVRFCPACGVAVYVPRETAAGLVCPKCLGPVQWHKQESVMQVQDLAKLVQLADDRLPPEVDAARRNPACVFGKYVIVDEIGSGGAGVVRKAWDTMLGQYVALKFIRTPSSVPGSVEEARRTRAEQIRDLLLEARAALKLRHPNIVPVHDADRHGDQFFLAMEYLEGNTLADHIRAAQSRGRLSPLYEDPIQYLGMLRDVCNAMHHAHTHPTPIVHCDLKPGNVLIGVDGRAYVMDFGLARVLGEGEQDARIRGTPAYMAPEQIHAKPGGVGPWTDIYALGAILYDLLTGRNVFVGDTPDLWERTTRTTPDRPTDLIRKSGEQGRADTARILKRVSVLESLCMRCLEKDPSRRPPSARDVAAELETVVAALRDGAQDTDVVPRRIIDAQRGAELRGIDESLTVFSLDEAVKQAERLETKYADETMRRQIADRKGHAEILGAFRARLIHRLNERRPRLPKFLLVKGALEGVEVLKALEERLILLHERRAMELGWSEIAHPQIVALAQAVELTGTDDRLALGIYCHHARLADQAIQFLDSLRGTPYEATLKGAMKTR